MAWLQPPSRTLCADVCHGRCCRAPGYLKLSEREATRMSTLAGHPLTVFRDPADQRLTMHFSENGGHCPLLSADNLCTWYSGRPVACQRFPEQPNPGCLVWPMEAAHGR